MKKTIKSIAHGRVNLIGEHTDYNGGFVLPTVIPQSTELLIIEGEDSRVTLQSTSVDPARKTFEYNLGEEKRAGHWADYIQGATWILRERFGFSLGGFHCQIESTVPMGSGLSSSAALEIALLKGLRKLFDLPLTDVQIAQIGQEIENDFVGARIGIMDQMASCLGEPGLALFLDTRSLTFERITLPLNELSLIVINSGVVHDHAQGDYNTRREQCEEACRLLGVQALRDVTSVAELSGLPDLILRRARHIVTENQRVLDAVDALREKQYQKFGELFLASHASMRDDYEISTPEMDRLVEIAMNQPGVIGARLTGGGFGGSIVALAKPHAAAIAAKQIVADYQKEFPLKASILVPAPTPPECALRPRTPPLFNTKLSLNRRP